MAIVVAFFCGLCFYKLADSIADYISAQARLIESKAEALGVQNKIKELEIEKGENK